MPQCQFREATMGKCEKQVTFLSGKDTFKYFSSMPNSNGMLSTLFPNKDKG